MVKEVPSRIYRCPDCGYINKYRWVLARHLYYVHGYGKRRAAEIAIENEYFLSPRYYRQQDLLRRYDEED